MKCSATVLFISVLSFNCHFAHADVVDDTIGNIQRAISDAYQQNGSRDNDDRQYEASRRRSDEQSQRYEDRRRQLEDRRRQLDDRQHQLDQERRQLDDEERRLEEED